MVVAPQGVTLERKCRAGRPPAQVNRRLRFGCMDGAFPVRRMAGELPVILVAARQSPGTSIDDAFSEGRFGRNCTSLITAQMTQKASSDASSSLTAPSFWHRCRFRCWHERLSLRIIASIIPKGGRAPSSMAPDDCERQGLVGTLAATRLRSSYQFPDGFCVSTSKS
jgi:hypothetical protein